MEIHECEFVLKIVDKLVELQTKQFEGLSNALLPIASSMFKARPFNETETTLTE